MRAGPRGGGGSAGRAAEAGPGLWRGERRGPARRCGRGTRRLGVRPPAAPVQLPESLGAFVLFVGFDLFEAFWFFIFPLGR